jgi:hypothetical protein
MLKAELFDINTSKIDQRNAEILLTPEQRIILCLDLMDLNASFSDRKETPSQDEIEWIELSFKHE